MVGDDRERELKLAVPTREDFERLVATGSVGTKRTCLLQTNHYFDTEDLLLARHSAMLRLRAERVLTRPARDTPCGDAAPPHEEGERPGLTLTFKQGAEDHETRGFFDAVEVESAEPPALLEEALREPEHLGARPSRPVEALRHRFGLLVFTYLGAVETERTRILGLPFRLELDHVHFPDGTRLFEIEIETNDPRGARRWADDLLRARGIEATPQRFTKLEELLQRQGRWRRAR